MGAICTNQPIQLPDYKETITGTTVPGFVAAGGKELYEQARELASSEFPAFQGERIATYGNKLDAEGNPIQIGTDADGNPIFEQERFSETERKGLDLLATGDDSVGTLLDDAETMAGKLGGGFTANAFTPTDADTLIGEEFEYDAFDVDKAKEFQDIFQTSIDPALEQLQRERDLRQRQNAADAIRAGAFGGSRLGIREALTDAEIARAGGDLTRQAGRDALQFASQRFDTDRLFDADRFDKERAARFAGEAEDRAGFETSEAARLRGFETDEASKLRATETLASLAPLAQGLNEQIASGMITAGQAERELDQRALDLAYQDFLQQQQFPFEMLNFALGALQGIPYETLTRSQATGNQFMQQPSIYGQTLGGLGTLASLYALSRRA